MTIRNALLLQVFVLCLLFLNPTKGQTKRALLIGISNYPLQNDTAWTTIHGANDVNLIGQTLKKQGYKITKLCNKAATAERIRKELNNLPNSCKKNDTVYIHFSCHGQPFEDLDKDEFDGWDESLIPYDAEMIYKKGKYEGTKHILDDELTKYLYAIRKSVGPKGFICVVIDACHAGGASRGDDDDYELICRGTQQGFSPSGKEYHPRISMQGHYSIPTSLQLSHIIILEACRSYQSNYEIKQEGTYYGPLSYYVNKMLMAKQKKFDEQWILGVKKLMDADIRLTRQNMVYETSYK